MSGLQAPQSTRFVTVDGRRLAVMDAGDWEAVVEWLEALEDAGIAAAARSILAAAHGDRARAGWAKWDSVRADLA